MTETKPYSTEQDDMTNAPQERPGPLTTRATPSGAESDEDREVIYDVLTEMERSADGDDMEARARVYAEREAYDIAAGLLRDHIEAGCLVESIHNRFDEIDNEDIDRIHAEMEDIIRKLTRRGLNEPATPSGAEPARPGACAECHVPHGGHMDSCKSPHAKWVRREPCPQCGTVPRLPGPCEVCPATPSGAEPDEDREAIYDVLTEMERSAEGGTMEARAREVCADFNGHREGGVCWRCKRIAAALRDAVREERERLRMAMLSDLTDWEQAMPEGPTWRGARIFVKDHLGWDNPKP